VSAQRRTQRDWRRRQLGQNFLRAEAARRFVADCALQPGELIVEIGAGAGAITEHLALAPVDVIAIEIDVIWAERLRERFADSRNVRVVAGDFFRFPFPRQPFRVVGSLPFSVTTDILRRLFEDPRTPLQRADLIVQWEAARRRAEVPPTTLASAAWAPWWDLRLGPRIPASAFRPVPRIDGGVLTVSRRTPAMLPETLGRAYERFIAEHWPF
jgi:23S rRNA (adenine-N6)-dimethyltransferase